MIRFEVKTRDAKTRARTGRLHLKHGVVETPVFMPVGTMGTVRNLSNLEMHQSGAEIMLGNTYHLFCRPGVDLIEKAGGLHAFMGWNRNLLTDSGGYQVFSLAHQRVLSEEGVVFRNPVNGDRIHLNAEKVIAIQERFGSDVMMILDECPPATATKSEVELAVDRTTRWAKRAIECRQREDLAMFPIVQGGSHLELRKKSMDDLLALESASGHWDGLAIGGLSVGESKDDFVRTLYGMRTTLPTDRACYLMGLGTPRDLIFAVACGVDMFDCVLPSRNGRHGIVMTRKGRLNLYNATCTEDFRPLEEGCECDTCRHYTRAFLRHLFMVGDTLAGRMCTLHNVHYFLKLMNDVRAHIENQTFESFAKEFLTSEDHVFLGIEKGFKNYPDNLM